MKNLTLTSVAAKSGDKLTAHRAVFAFVKEKPDREFLDLEVTNGTHETKKRAALRGPFPFMLRRLNSSTSASEQVSLKEAKRK